MISSIRKYLKDIQWQYPLFAAVLFLLLSQLLYGYFRRGDDTYIYLQYAKHLIERGEFSFNAGEISYGFTGPLWLLLITVTSLITGDLLNSPQYLTLFFSIGSVFVWYHIIRTIDTDRKFILIALALTIFEPNLLKHSNFGMEASLSFFLSSLLAGQLLQEKFKPALIGLTIGAYLLIRPEAFVVFAVLCAYYLLKRKINPRGGILLIISAAVIVLPWMIFAYSYFGNFLPDTLRAKGTAFPYGRMFFTHIVDTVKIFGGGYGILILLISPLVIAYRKKLQGLLPAGIIICALPLFYAVTLSNELVYARYYCIVFPFLHLLILLAMNLLLRMNPRIQTIGFAAVIIQVGVTIFLSIANRPVYAATEQASTEIISWVKQNTKPNDIIFTGAIGKIAYETDRKILDPMGLVNKDIVPYNASGKTAEYITLIKPAYIIGNYDDLIAAISSSARVENVHATEIPETGLLRNGGTEKSKRIDFYRLTW